MKFTVVLTTPCEQDLAAAWLASEDRPAVTVAAHLMDQKLAADPLNAGESRASSVSRLDHTAPLGFAFDIVVDYAMVFITAIWLVS